MLWFASWCTAMWLLASPFLVVRLCSVSLVLKFLPVSPIYNRKPGRRSIWCEDDFRSGSRNVSHQQQVSTVRRIRQQLWFNHRCKDQVLVPARLKLKSPLNTQEATQIVKFTCRRLVKARINDCHRRLNYCNNKLQQQLDHLIWHCYDNRRQTSRQNHRPRSYWTRTKTDKTSTQ